MVAASQSGVVTTFRRLTPSDTNALVALGQDAWWMAPRPALTVMALLSNPAMRVYGLFEGSRLLASAALLTDSLTKALLADVVVETSHRGTGLGNEIIARTMATVPPHIEGILYCRNELIDLYVDHEFRVDDSYSLMLRREA